MSTEDEEKKLATKKRHLEELEEKEGKEDLSHREQSEMQKLRRQIIEIRIDIVDREIHAITEQIHATTAQIHATTDQEKKNDLQEKKKDLQDEKNDLQHEKKRLDDEKKRLDQRLDDEKKRLHEKEILLLQSQSNSTQGDVEIVTREFMHLELEKLRETIKSELDTERSENKSMSSAGTQFASEILYGNRVGVSESADRTAPSSSFSFDWNPGEDARTDAALKQLETIMSLDQQDVELIDARRCTLRVNAARKASSGQLDGLITETHSSTFFGLARGGVEFKTNKAKFNVVQMQLETLGLSLVSSYGQGVALLGTDLCTQWTTFHFDKPNHILVTKFLDGQTALQAFQELLETCKTRFQSHAPALSSIPEHSALPVSSPFDQEQDLSGSIPPSEAENLKNFQFLQAHAAHLSKLHGCEVNAPSWVLQTKHSPPMSYAARQMFA